MFVLEHFLYAKVIMWSAIAILEHVESISINLIRMLIHAEVRECLHFLEIPSKFEL